MFPTEENSNSSNTDVTFWRSFSSYKKFQYISQNVPDCSFVVAMDSLNSKTFPAHKSILRSATAVFDDMFNDQNLSKEIILSDTEPQVFKKFLDFIYYGDDDNLNCADANTLRSLISLGKKFKVDELVKTCVEAMKLNLLNAENYDLINIFEYACISEDINLITDCKRVIVGRAKGKPKFQDFNLNQQQEEKRHIQFSKKQLNGGPQTLSNKPTSTATCASVAENNVYRTQMNSQQNKAPNSTAAGGGLNILGATSSAGATFAAPQIQFPSQHSFAFSSTPTSQPTEEKLQNTENNNSNETPTANLFNPIFSIGVNKGNITDCACIYNLTPSVFYEFQITLIGYISELSRFNMIENYAKINGLIGDDIEKINSEVNETLAKSDTPRSNASSADLQKQSAFALSKQILNMMLRTIKFHRMTAKEFCSGPDKSSLLELAEKHYLLVTIVNKN